MFMQLYARRPCSSRVKVFFTFTIALVRDGGGTVHIKKRLEIFPSPAGMSLTKLTLTGNSDIPAGDGKLANLFLQCNSLLEGKEEIPCCLEIVPLGVMVSIIPGIWRSGGQLRQFMTRSQLFTSRTIL